MSINFFPHSLSSPCPLDTAFRCHLCRFPVLLSSLSGQITASPCPLLLSAPDNSFLKCALDLDISIMIQQGLQKCCKLDLKEYIKMNSLSVPKGILGETRITKRLPLPGNKWYRQQNKIADKYKGKLV